MARWFVAMIAGLALGLPSARADGPAGGNGVGPVVLEPAKEYPRAGISLGVPKGYEPKPLSAPYDVMSAAVMEDGRPVRAVTLSAFPVGESTIDDFAEAQMAELKRNLAIRHLKMMRKTAMTVAGIPGAARLLSYTFRGVATLAAQVYFLRELPGTKVRICYLLTVVCSADQQARLLPTLGAVVKSVQFSGVRHPSVPAEVTLAAPITDPRLGYSIRPPAAWYGAPSHVGVEMGEVDYLLGGLPLPSMQLMVSRATGDATTSEACAKQNLAMARTLAEKRNQGVKVVSEGPTKLGELGAYQFALLATAKTPAPAGRSELSAESVALIQRTACVAPSGEQKPAVYMLILMARPEEIQAATALMDVVARGFQRVEAATQPASQPATQPTGPAATRPASKPAGTAPAPS